MKQFDVDNFTFETLLSVYLTGIAMQNDIENFLIKYKISHGRFSILLTLYKKLNEWVAPSYLSKELNKKKPTITGMMKKLLDERLVVQIDNKTDGRSKLYKLSRLGYDTLGTIIPEYNRRIIEMGTNLTNAEKKQLQLLIKKIKI